MGERNNPVFVYGTLMQGQRAHYMLEGSGFVGKFRLENYGMYNLGTYPGIKPCPGARVFGEVYLVDDQTVERMDQYESNGTLYHRTPVTVVDDLGEMDVQVYIYAGSVENLPLEERPWPEI